MDKAAIDGENRQTPAFAHLELFPFERRERIMETLKARGKVVAAELAQSMQVSIDVVYRRHSQLAGC